MQIDTQDLLIDKRHKVVLINDNWLFQREIDTDWEQINLPHTWNALDGQDGGSDYFRGTGKYQRTINVSADSIQNRRLYIEFQGVNAKMEFYINDTFIGRHSGGYTTFRFDITDHISTEQENVFTVLVSNKGDGTVAPISGDFTFFGGIYRNVSLIFTDSVHIDKMDCGAGGVYLTPENVSEKSADLRINTKIVNDSQTARTVSVVITLRTPKTFFVSDIERKYMEGIIRFDPDKMCSDRIIDTIIGEYTIQPGEDKTIFETIHIDSPRLWAGLTDPYRYQVDVSVCENGVELDRNTSYTGFRTYSVDKEKGFFLNGKSYPLRGVAMHQDFENMGNAVRQNEITKSFALLYEVGANVVRLSHYPHSHYTYDLCDKYGLVVYAEIPFVNSFGGSGTYDAPDVTLRQFMETTRNQLTEMIRQQYNRPSVFFWGLFNEAQKARHDVMVPFVAELNKLAHTLDATRLTVGATFSEEGELMAGDLLGWNTYPAAGGLLARAQFFYEGMSGDEVTADSKRHGPHYIQSLASAGYYKDVLKRPVGISEYGIGGSIYQHTDDFTAGLTTLKIQPEEYQAYCHETWLKQIEGLDYLWGTFVWNMFDFSADNRDEATKPGVNTKGLVTRDRSIRKDSFYIYKATWRKDIPVLYITGKNNTTRYTEPTYFKVYSNCSSVTLYVDDKMIGTLYARDNRLTNVFLWHYDQALGYGTHVIEAVGDFNGEKVSDRLIMSVNKRADTSIASELLHVHKEKKQIGLVGDIEVARIGEYVQADEGATLQVRAADGVTDIFTGNIELGMQLLVTAQNGKTTAMYTFTQVSPEMLFSITVAASEVGNPPENMMDGSLQTRWAGPTGYPTDIVIDYGQIRHISSISIKWYQARIYKYIIETSLDGENYTVAVDRSENTQGGIVADSFDMIMARFVRIHVISVSVGNWVSIYEVMTDAWSFNTEYEVDEINKTITVPYDPAVVISKEEFITALGLSDGSKASVSTGDVATVYYITDGAVLTIICGGITYKYTLIYRS